VTFRFFEGADMTDDKRDDAVTQWISRLKAGDEQAAEQLFRYYYDRAFRLAHRQLEGVPCREKDEEDMAASVFESLFCGARAGQYHQYHERDDFWRLIHTICTCKVRDQIRRLRAQKRAPEVGESALGELSDSRGFAGIHAVPGGGPTPDDLAAVAENIRRLLDLLTASCGRRWPLPA
jgi:DNA-directed RNA polymerase specialized sigma24 family protein